MIQTPKQHSLFITLCVLANVYFPCVRAHWIRPKSDSLWGKNHLVGMDCTYMSISYGLFLMLSLLASSGLHLPSTVMRVWLSEGWVGALGDERFSFLYSIIQLNVYWKLGGLYLMSAGFPHLMSPQEVKNTLDRHCDWHKYWFQLMSLFPSNLPCTLCVDFIH